MVFIYRIFYMYIIISQRQLSSLAFFEIQSPTRNSEEEKVVLQKQSTTPKER